MRSVNTTVAPVVRRRPCPSCGVEVLSVDIEGETMCLEVGEVDPSWVACLLGEDVLLGEDDVARRCFPSIKRRKGEALHRVHMCALADVA